MNLLRVLCQFECKTLFFITLLNRGNEKLFLKA